MMHSPSFTALVFETEMTALQKRHRKKELIWVVVFLLLTAMMVHMVSAVLRPVQTIYGSTWQAFLAEPEDSLDVIWLGSSVAYCDVNPSAVYEQSGLTGFVMAGGEQTLSLTYWYLKEALKTQSPATVVLEGTGVFFQTYQNYTQQNISTMPSGANKAGAIFTGAEPELRQDLLFDLSLYHERWRDVDADDVKRLFRPGKWDEYKGFTPMSGRVDGAGENVWEKDRDVTPEVYAENLAWLERILSLCRERGIQVIVTINPACSRCTPAAYAKLKEKITQMDSDIVFCNWSGAFQEIGLIPTEHFYDNMHLNEEGAQVFSAWLGRVLSEEFGLVPREQTEENTTAWQKAVEYWNDRLVHK